MLPVAGAPSRRRAPTLIVGQRRRVLPGPVGPLASRRHSGRRGPASPPPPASDLGGELGPGGDVQLGEHVCQVGLDGPPRDEQPLADLRVRQPVGHQGGHRPFGRCQALRAELRPLARAPDAPLDAGAAQDRLRAGQVASGVEGLVDGDRLLEQRARPPQVALLDECGRRVLCCERKLQRAGRRQRRRRRRRPGRVYRCPPVPGTRNAAPRSQPRSLRDATSPTAAATRRANPASPSAMASRTRFAPTIRHSTLMPRRALSSQGAVMVLAPARTRRKPPAGGRAAMPPSWSGRESPGRPVLG